MDLQRHFCLKLLLMNLSLYYLGEGWFESVMYSAPAFHPFSSAHLLRSNSPTPQSITWIRSEKSMTARLTGSRKLWVKDRVTDKMSLGKLYTHLTDYAKSYNVAWSMNLHRRDCLPSVNTTENVEQSKFFEIQPTIPSGKPSFLHSHGNTQCLCHRSFMIAIKSHDHHVCCHMKSTFTVEFCETVWHEFCTKAAEHLRETNQDKYEGSQGVPASDKWQKRDWWMECDKVIPAQGPLACFFWGFQLHLTVFISG